MIKLRGYQDDMGAAVEAALLDHGQNRVLLQAATGTGKTVLFASLLKRARLGAWLARFQRRGAQMLIIAHREELLDQAAAKIRDQNPGLMVDIEQGERRASRYADVVIASIQTLSARKYTRLQNLLRAHTFRIVVVDEAHHVAADTYRTTLAHLGFLPLADISEGTETEAATFDDVELMAQALEGWDAKAPKDRLLLGVTATPNRSDAIGLGCVFQTIAYSYPIKRAIEDSWLVPIKPWVIETAENLDAVRISHGDFNQKDLAESVNTERRNHLTVESWALHAREESTLAFTVDVAHAHDLADAWRAHGFTAAALSGETPKDERRDILRRYTAGDLQVITNCMVLTEGTDLPRTGCIVHAKPTKSATLYEQMTGRGLRIHPGKTECKVIDLVDIARKHSLMTAPALFGLPPGLKADGADLRKIAEELEKLRANYPALDVDGLLAQGRFTLEELQRRASTFDIWKLPELGAFGVGRKLPWIKLGDVYQLKYPWADGTETVDIGPDLLGTFGIVCTLRPADKAIPWRRRTLAQGIHEPIGARRVAEAWVERDRPAVFKMKALDAGWRQQPANEKQRGALLAWRIPFNPKTITKGDASSLLDLASARAGRR